MKVKVKVRVKRLVLGLAAMVVMGTGFASGDEKLQMRNLMPKGAMGWHWDGMEEVYDPQTIFDYIDGAGEVYRAYNFKLLLVRRYRRSGQPSIVVDLFDMGSSEDAFGVFSFEREGDDVGIGQDSEYGGGMLRFWKGRFFVCASAAKETASAKRAIFQLGKAIADVIKTAGSRPNLLKLLPKK